MTYKDIIVEARDGVGTITLNRPDKLNAFADQMRQEIAAGVQELGERPDVRVLVVTGAGRAFCAGADVNYMRELQRRRDVEGMRAVIRAGAEAVTAIRQAAQPVIASLNGPAAGAGANLALSCDLRIASERAYIGQSFNRVGLHPDWGGTYFLPRLVGPAIAAELFFGGEMIDAAEAHRLGIFNRVVPDERLAEETKAWAGELAAKPRLPQRRVKRAVQLSLSSTLEEMLEYELEAQLECATSTDAVEGIQAFLEKRDPEFGREGDDA